MLTAEITPVIKKKAAFIDDAFDDISPKDISGSDLKNFFSLALDGFEPFLVKLLDEAGLKLETDEILGLPENSADLIKLGMALWNNLRNELIKGLLDQVQPFARKLSQLQEVDSVCINMEREDFEVMKFPSSITSVSKFKEGNFDYIFIDYFLGNPENDSAIKKSVALAGRIYDSYGEGKKPMTILMSSNPNIKSHKDQYRKDANMPEGAFRFFPKSDLADSSKAPLIAKAFKKDFSSSLVLQEYVKSLMGAAERAAKTFALNVTALKIEDYELILNSSLREEKQPLGSYLAWLYGAHWSNLLQTDKDLQERQAKVDELLETEKPIYYEQPSDELANLYMTALYEVVPEDIACPSWFDKDPNISNLPMLQLGDLFVKNGDHAVHMVITPQCDLERPNNEKLENTILVIPGSLREYESSVEKDAIKTDFFYYEGTKSKIIWDTKCVISISFKGFLKWVEEGNYHRKFRMRLPYALDIQQRFVSDIGRVGLPVTPPLSKKLNVQVGLYFPGERIKLEFLPKSDDYAFLTKNSLGKFKAWLTMDFALAFKSQLVKEVEKLQEKFLGTELAKDKSEALATLVDFRDNFENWFFDEETEFNMPTLQKNQVTFGKYFTILLGEKTKSQSFKTLFWLSIL